MNLYLEMVHWSVIIVGRLYYTYTNLLRRERRHLAQVRPELIEVDALLLEVPTNLSGVELLTVTGSGRLPGQGAGHLRQRVRGLPQRPLSLPWQLLYVLHMLAQTRQHVIYVDESGQSTTEHRR